MYARASTVAWFVVLSVGARPGLGAVPEAPINDNAAITTSAAPAVAQVSVHGSAADRAALADILRDLLASRATLSVVPHDRLDPVEVLRASRALAPRGDVVAWVWIELDDAQQVALYVADGGGERILVRHVQRAHVPDEVVFESVARVAATAIEALLQGERIGVPREEFVRVPPSSAPPAEVRAESKASSASGFGLTWRAGVFWGAQLFAPKLTLAEGPGALFGGALGSGLFRTGVTFTAQAWLPRSVTDSVLNLQLFSASPRLLISADYAASARMTLSAGVGGGVDVTRVRTTALAGSVGLHPTAAQTLLTAELRAAVGASLGISDALSLALIGYVDTDLSGTHYVVESSGNQSAFLRPWLVRPGLMLGVITP